MCSLKIYVYILGGEGGSIENSRKKWGIKSLASLRGCSQGRQFLNTRDNHVLTYWYALQFSPLWIVHTHTIMCQPGLSPLL